MKTLIMLMLFAITSLYAEIKEDSIKTSAVCDKCKERIEGKFKQVRKLESYNLNFETGIFTVKYDTEKIELKEIKKIVSQLGYDADDIKADPKAYAKLPKCCKHK